MESWHIHQQQLIKLYQQHGYWIAKTHMITTGHKDKAQAAYDAGVASGLIEIMNKRFPTDEERTPMMTQMEATMLAVMDEMTEDKDEAACRDLLLEQVTLVMEWNTRFPEFLPCLSRVLDVPHKAQEILF